MSKFSKIFNEFNFKIIRPNSVGVQPCISRNLLQQITFVRRSRGRRWSPPHSVGNRGPTSAIEKVFWLCWWNKCILFRNKHYPQISDSKHFCLLAGLKSVLQNSYRILCHQSYKHHEYSTLDKHTQQLIKFTLKILCRPINILLLFSGMLVVRRRFVRCGDIITKTLKELFS